jgi:hypothetical protein
MLNKLRIKCIGFSVTGFGNPSYPIAMENCFKKSGDQVEVSYSSVGGLSIDALPYLLKTIVKKDEVDLVIVEIATSWFSFVRTHQEEANNYVKLIISYLESIHVRIIFLNLYRKDTNDNDIVVQAIQNFAKDKYPILDFKEHYRKQFLEMNNDGTTDGVHPTPETIDHFSSNICEFIRENFNSLKQHRTDLKEESYFDLLTLKMTENNNHFFDNRHGLAMSSVKISQGEVIEMNFEKKQRISGIFYIFGPDTNQVNLTLDDECINIPMRDEMSFYRRIGYRYLGVRDVEYLRIEHPFELVDAKLIREPWEKIDGFKNYIIGFSAGI